MESQDKGSKSIGLQFEAKEGERGPLSCNKANVRSPSLEFNNDNSLISEKMQLDTLAKILVEIYVEHKRNGNKN